MTLAEQLLPELDHEMANTRRMLERVPDDKLDWRPHPKSMTLGRLAGHVAELPSWGEGAIQTDSLDLANTDRKAYVAPSRQALLAKFDANVAAVRQALAGANDAHLAKTWTLLMGPRTILRMPRLALLRRVVLNHIIHHRAQLGVYLRLNDVPLPPLYGPSADEGAF